jgi:hypothetical protein
MHASNSLGTPLEIDYCDQFDCACVTFVGLFVLVTSCILWLSFCCNKCLTCVRAYFVTDQACIICVFSI